MSYIKTNNYIMDKIKLLLELLTLLVMILLLLVIIQGNTEKENQITILSDQIKLNKIKIFYQVKYTILI